MGYMDPKGQPLEDFSLTNGILHTLVCKRGWECESRLLDEIFIYKSIEVG